MAKCIGCGIKLQYIDESAPGFVDAEILSDLGEETYCKRCYQIIHHNVKYLPTISNKDYYNKIDVIKNHPSIVILMVDVMNIYGSFIPNLKIHIGDNPLILVVNKIDVMPKDIHLKNIEGRLRSIAAKEGLNVSSVVMISAKNKKNILEVLSRIDKLKYKFSQTLDKKTKVTDCYVLGCASTGKSTFLNAVRKVYLDKEAILTTSDQYQTTLDFIKIPLNKENFLIDTPGLINYESFGAYLDYETMKVITPKNYIKPRTYQLRPSQTIFLAGLAKVDFTKGNNLNVSFYVSNELYIHRTKYENSESLWNERRCDLLKPPFNEEELSRLKEEKTVSFKGVNGTHDLLISGVGFIHIVGEDVNIDVTVSKNITVTLVETFL